MTLRDLEIQSKFQLVILSGDAHMIAVDNGTYSPGGIPVFHAAALGRPGSIKGGPYSHGAFPGTGQFGTVEIRDTPGQERPCLYFEGRNAHNRTIVQYDSCDPPMPLLV